MTANSNEPFKFGEVVSSSIFLNRKEDIERLHTNFKSGINTLLISPRRWGKSSLVKKAAETYKGKKTVFVFMDCFRVHSKQQFFEEFATKVVAATANKMEEQLQAIKTFFGNLVPEIGFSPDQHSEVSFKLKWSKTLPEAAILDLPQTIAIDKGIKVILCIDEFQNIAQFDSKHHFQKELRSYWQHHSEVTYCLYGSKRHLMVKFFNKVSMPFYRFGDMIFLEKITREHWQQYIVKRFSLFNKKIDNKLAIQIADLVQCHSYYVQQLAHITFHRTPSTATEEVLKESVIQLLENNQILYQRVLEDLSPPQMEFLRAMTDGVTSFYSKKVNKDYELGSVGNIKRIREALEAKEVIDLFNKQPTFVDPVFELWFKSFYLDRPINFT
jgi:AAA+ ATPase superfamily predicted ATPase